MSTGAASPVLITGESAVLSPGSHPCSAIKMVEDMVVFVVDGENLPESVQFERTGIFIGEQFSYGFIMGKIVMTNDMDVLSEKGCVG